MDEKTFLKAHYTQTFSAYMIEFGTRKPADAAAEGLKMQFEIFTGNRVRFVGSASQE